MWMVENMFLRSKITLLSLAIAVASLPASAQELFHGFYVGQSKSSILALSKKEGFEYRFDKLWPGVHEDKEMVLVLSTNKIDCAGIGLDQSNKSVSLSLFPCFFKYNSKGSEDILKKFTNEYGGTHSFTAKESESCVEFAGVKYKGITVLGTKYEIDELCDSTPVVRIIGE